MRTDKRNKEYLTLKSMPSKGTFNDMKKLPSGVLRLLWGQNKRKYMDTVAKGTAVRYEADSHVKQ